MAKVYIREDNINELYELLIHEITHGDAERSDYFDKSLKYLKSARGWLEKPFGKWSDSDRKLYANSQEEVRAFLNQTREEILNNIRTRIENTIDPYEGHRDSLGKDYYVKAFLSSIKNEPSLLLRFSSDWRDRNHLYDEDVKKRFYQMAFHLAQELDNHFN